MTTEHAGLGDHHDVIPSANKQPGMIRTRVAALLEAGKIDEAEHTACIRFRTDWEIGMEGASPGGGMKVRVDADNGGSALDRRIDAMTRIRNVKRHLLGDDYLILAGLVANDLPYAWIAKAFNIAETTAKRRGINAVKELAAVYALLDSKRRP